MDPAPSEPDWRAIEQPEGPPLVPPVDGAAVDARRRQVYESYETFLRARLADLDRTRPERWPRDYADPDAYQRSVAPLRAQLQTMLGFWLDPTERPTLRAGDPEPLYEDDTVAAVRFSLEIVPGLETYAVEVVPKEGGGAPRPGLLAQHGYGGTPELVVGLTPTANDRDYAYRSLGLRAARRGFHVLAVHHPTGYGQDGDTVRWSLPGFPQYPNTYGKNRLHRLATMAGGTLFGLDMMASSRGIDLLRARPGVDPARVGVYGLSQGGQSALYLAALDPRVRASVASAWFNARTRKMVGPHRATTYLDSPEEDKFFPQIVSHFADADLVSLVAPRAFAVEAGLHDSSVDFEGAAEEFARARVHHERLGVPERVAFLPHREGHVSATAAALDFLQEHLS